MALARSQGLNTPKVPGTGTGGQSKFTGSSGFAKVRRSLDIGKGQQFFNSAGRVAKR